MATAKLDIWAVSDPDEKEGFKLMLMPPEKKWYMNESDVRIDTVVVQYAPPEGMDREQMAMKAVETLRDKQKQIQAEAQKRITKLESKINDLLMISHQSNPLFHILGLKHGPYVWFAVAIFQTPLAP